MNLLLTKSGTISDRKIGVNWDNVTIYESSTLSGTTISFVNPLNLGNKYLEPDLHVKESFEEIQELLRLEDRREDLIHCLRRNLNRKEILEALEDV